MFIVAATKNKNVVFKKNGAFRDSEKITKLFFS